jgi:ABC-type branched-subunit amino acid transport system substrate-binding protein
MGKKLPRIFKRVFFLKLLTYTFIITILFFCIARPQAHDFLNDPADGLKAATINYQNGKFTEAYNNFISLAEKFPNDSHNSIFRFMAAKSLYMSGEYQRSLPLWDGFIADFSGSSYLPEASLFKGHTLFMLKQFSEAASAYLSAIDRAPRSDAAQIARENLMPLLRQGLSIKKLNELIVENSLSAMGETMEYTLARREIDSGHYRKGVGFLKAFITRYPGSKDFKQARILLEQAQEKSENQIEIGLLAPITGTYQDYGQSMVEGARLAMKSYKNEGFKVDLAIRDTQGEPIQAAKIASALADEEPAAVVGPLRSESSISAAIVLNERGIPMITPTASEAGLSTIGPYIFQISPSIEQIGQELARYAVKTLKITEFAIIAPDDANGTKISNAFAEAVYAMGGEVILTSYYESGSTDFKQQIMPLRDILLVKTEGQLANGRIDSAEFIDKKSGQMLTEEEWPVTLGGLFLPGYVDDLKLLIPQIRYHIIHTRFFGSDSWDSADLMKEVKAYIEDAIFASDFHIDSSDANWAKFAKAYSSIYKHPPDKVAALTFDAVTMILEGIHEGHKHPEDLRNYINEIESFQGVSGVISFKDMIRANNGVGVYSIDGKRLGKTN